MNPTLLNRISLSLAIIGIFFFLPSIASQLGFISADSQLWYLTIVFDVISGVLWCSALCFLSKARGHHPLWGLTLLFPPMIFIYTQVFPDKRKTELDETKKASTTDTDTTNS